MHMLYEQDVDLGYNWQNNEPVKQLKDPNDVSLMKTDSLVSATNYPIKFYILIIVWYIF